MRPVGAEDFLTDVSMIASAGTAKTLYDDLTYPSLEVKSSNIKGAGNGQFTQEYIAKGTIIGEYTGEIVNNRGRSSTEDLSQLAISKCEHALHNQAII
jgi:hypothetical protein